MNINDPAPLKDVTPCEGPAASGMRQLGILLRQGGQINAKRTKMRNEIEGHLHERRADGLLRNLDVCGDASLGDTESQSGAIRRTATDARGIIAPQPPENAEEWESLRNAFAPPVSPHVHALISEMTNHVPLPSIKHVLSPADQMLLFDDNRMED